MKTIMKNTATLHFSVIVYSILFAGMTCVEAADYYWNQTGTTNANKEGLETASNWVNLQGETYTTGPSTSDNLRIGNDSVFTYEGDLIHSADILIGHYNNTKPDSTVPGSSSFTVTGDLTTNNLYIGQMYFASDTKYYWSGSGKENDIHIAKSLGRGELTVEGSLTIQGQKGLYLGQDSTASLVVKGEVTIGSVDSWVDRVRISSQGASLGGDHCSVAGKEDGTLEPVMVDWSQTKQVTIYSDKFLVSSRDDTNNTNPITWSNNTFNDSDRTYKTNAIVELGTNNNITTKQFIVASSYGINLSGTHAKVTLGEGLNNITSDYIIIGNLKADKKDDVAADAVNVVSVRQTDIDGTLTNTGTVNIIANSTASADTGLYVGFQNCDTNNLAYGTLDLRNAKEVTMTLNNFVIGEKKEVGTGYRTGGSQGFVYLGDNATVTANLLKMA